MTRYQGISLPMPKGNIDPESITQETIRQYLATKDYPDPEPHDTHQRRIQDQ